MREPAGRPAARSGRRRHDPSSPEPILAVCDGTCDVAALRALAECAGLAESAAGLTDGYGVRLAAGSPLAPLAREIARALMNAALAQVLVALGYAVRPFGSGKAWLAIDRRACGAETGP